MDKKKGNVLIVEDDVIQAKYIEDKLEDFGYSVAGVLSTGEDAIRKAEQKRPDLVLMDIKLKGKMSGTDAAEQIKQKFDIPVIFITSYSDEETLGSAKISEPYGYILKPFKDRELYASIDMALYKHQFDKERKSYIKIITSQLKELDCHYKILKLMGDKRIKLENIFKSVVNILQMSFSNPEKTGVKVSYEGNEYQTYNFQESKSNIVYEIKVLDQNKGLIEIYFAEEKDSFKVFHDSEENLIKSIAEELGRTIERRFLEKDAANRDKIKSQLEWLSYKESRRIADRDYTETKSIDALKTSISQGAGLGSLVTLIDTLKSAVKEKEGKYVIDKGLLDLIFDNNDYCRVMIEGLQRTSDLMEKDFVTKEVSSSMIIKTLPEMIKEVLPYLEKKNIKVTYPDNDESCHLMVNMESLSMVIMELMINAYKYTVNNSTINIFSNISEGYFWISIKNDIIEKPYGGIPKEYEKVVLEPFFRLRPQDESIGKIEKFGFGLGLTMVDNMARKHGGVFLIHDVKDYTEKNIKNCTLAELLLPVLKK